MAGTAKRSQFDDPMLWYRLGEPSGTVAYDETTNSYDGTFGGTPTLGEPGLVGDADTAVQFNGTDPSVVGEDHVQTPTLPIGALTEFSLEVVLKPATISGGDADPYFHTHQHIALGPHPIFQARNALDLLAPGFDRVFAYKYTDSVSGAHQLTGTTSYEPETVYHVVFTIKNGGSAKLYVAGALEGEDVLEGDWDPHGDGAWLIASTGPGAEEPNIRAVIDEFELFDHELPDARVAAHAAAIGTGPGDPCTLEATDGLLLIDASAGTGSVALPAAETVLGRSFHVKKIDATENSVSLNPFGSELIDGEASFVLENPDDAVMIVSDGVAWWIL